MACKNTRKAIARLCFMERDVKTKEDARLIEGNITVWWSKMWVNVQEIISPTDLSCDSI